MIQLIPQLRILLACQPVDFRNGIDGLAALCKRALEEDPFSGALFVFRNRRGTALKLLCYDGVGFWLVTRRLSEGRIRWWPASADTPLHALEAQQLSVLLYNGLPDQAGFAPAWRKLPNPDPQAARPSSSDSKEFHGK
jgi:transposase